MNPSTRDLARHEIDRRLRDAAADHRRRQARTSATRLRLLPSVARR